MGLPTQPVTLSVEQIADLNQKLSLARHDIGNHLSLILAATELMQRRPQTVERMIGAIGEQPPKITEAVSKFSREFEAAFGITRT